MAAGPMSYQDVCRIVGRLFLESQQEIERVAQGTDNPVVAALREQLKIAERKLQEAETLLQKRREG